jgi:hypothetical protein
VIIAENSVPEIQKESYIDFQEIADFEEIEKNNSKHFGEYPPIKFYLINTQFQRIANKGAFIEQFLFNKSQ